MADPPKKRPAKLAGAESIAPAVYALNFALLPGDQMHFDAGQFVTFYVPKNGATVTRSYSIASSPDLVDSFDLCLKRVDGGYVSTLLCNLPPGQELRMVAPLGKFVLREPDGRKVVFLATGTGIAPFVPMTEVLFRRRPEQPAWLFFGARTEPEILYRSRYEALQRAHPSFHYVPTLSRPEPSWTGAIGHIEEPLKRTLPDLSGCDVYICGVPPMVQEAQNLCLALGCPKDRLFVERY